MGQSPSIAGRCTVDSRGDSAGGWAGLTNQPTTNQPKLTNQTQLTTCSWQGQGQAGEVTLGPLVAGLFSPLVAGVGIGTRSHT